MDDKRNEEMSVDELLAKLKASLENDDSEEKRVIDNDGDDEIKKALLDAIGVESDATDDADEAAAEKITEEAVADETEVEEAENEVEAETVTVTETADEDVSEETDAETVTEDKPADDPVFPHINEEDVLAAWGIDRAETAKQTTAEIPAVSKEDYEKPAASKVFVYRIKRVESVEDNRTRKQTEAQKNAIEYDRSDCDLIKQALGIEKLTEEKTGSETVFDVEEPAHEKTIDAPRAEFTYQRQKDDIVADYKKREVTSLVQLVITAVLAILLFAVECLPAFGVNVPEIVDVAHFPVIFSMVTLQLMLLCGAISYKEIVNGFFSITCGKITSGGLLCILVAVSAVCGIINCMLGSAGQSYHFSASFLALIVRIFDYCDIRRGVLSFDIVSRTNENKHVAVTVPGDEVNEIDGLEEFTGDGSLVIRADKCSFVENYFARTGKRVERDVAINKYLLPVLVAVALISLITVFATGKGAADAFGAFNLAFAVGIPVIVTLSSSYPIYKAVKKLYRKDSTIVGESTLDEYSGTTMICFDDADAFPSYGVAIENLRIYGSADIETIIEQMGAVFSKLGGPLKNVFHLMTSECPKPYRVKIEGVYENGIKATVDARPVIIGNVAFMQENGFKILDKSNEIGGKRFSTMFLAEDGNLRAKFYIRYTLEGGFETMVKKLARHGVCSVILTGDSNINEELLSQFIDVSRLPIKVVRRSEFDSTPTAGRADSGLVSCSGVGELVNTVTMCDKLASVIGALRAVRIASAVICALLVIGASLLSMSGTIASGFVLVYHLFWMLSAWLISKFKL